MFYSGAGFSAAGSGLHMPEHETHLCTMCRRQRPLTYRRDRDEYICDDCWDELPVQSTNDGSITVDCPQCKGSGLIGVSNRTFNYRGPGPVPEDARGVCEVTCDACNGTGEEPIDANNQ